MPSLGLDPVDAILDQQLQEIEGADLARVRAFWQERWGPAPPKIRSAELLRLLAAWRLQAPVQGSLDPKTKRRLRDRAPPRLALEPGTLLTREYRGVLCEVEVLTDGYRYGGRLFGSLSEVARLITGSRWNGPKFFGLREPPQ